MKIKKSRKQLKKLNEKIKSKGGLEVEFKECTPDRLPRHLKRFMKEKQKVYDRRAKELIDVAPGMAALIEQMIEDVSEEE